MAKIPSAVAESHLSRLLGKYLHRFHQGKVRDSYLLPDYDDLMLVVATNRCSIFDFVLNTTIPHKGAILTAMNVFGTKYIVGNLCPTDFVACGSDIVRYLPRELRGNIELQQTGTIVRKFTPPTVEDVVRNALTGSGYKSYLKDGTICGHRLSPGIKDGNLLSYFLYTPTTKASVGHDMPITADSVGQEFGSARERLALQLLALGVRHADGRGVVLADVKFELTFYINEKGERVWVLVDECCTLDSSRIWDKRAWKAAQSVGKLPPPLDKQYVREWGKSCGINELPNPEDPDALLYVQSQIVPDAVIRATSELYRYGFWRWTGFKLEEFQRVEMGINVAVPKPSVHVIVGSNSDFLQIERGISHFESHGIPHKVHVISCHRNRDELSNYVADIALHQDERPDRIIAGAGMAAALPGVLKAELCNFGLAEIPVIGVAFQGKTDEDNLAAQLSIECLPEQPVELDKNGDAYVGPDGFFAACESAMHDEFLTRGYTHKPAEFNVDIRPYLASKGILS